MLISCYGKHPTALFCIHIIALFIHLAMFEHLIYPNYWNRCILSKFQLLGFPIKQPLGCLGFLDQTIKYLKKTCQREKKVCASLELFCQNTTYTLLMPRYLLVVGWVARHFQMRVLFWEHSKACDLLVLISDKQNK